MIIKGTRQLGSFRRGINLYVPKRRSGGIEPPAAFPSSISLEGNFGFINNAPPELFPITSLGELATFESEIGSLAGVEGGTITIPYRIYLSTAPNGSGGYDYIYMIYLVNATGGYYADNISAGRWFIGNGYSYQGDNSGYYSNFGYHTALQSKLTLPSSNIANWTRLAGYYPNVGSITNITFNP
jgi:hypothetical protein